MKLSTSHLLTLLLFSLSATLSGQKFTNQGFNVPDTVCAGDSFDIVSSNAPKGSYVWTFCQPDFSQNFTHNLIGNPGMQLNTCNNGDLIFDGTNYYLFITNYFGNIIRLDFGTSALNTPTATNIGNPVQGSDRLAGVQVVEEGGDYYLFYVGRGCGLTRLDFGKNLTSTPTVNQLGSFGMSWPHQMVMFQDSGKWYGFVANRAASNVTQLNFGTKVTNTPTAVQHKPLAAGMSSPRSLQPIKHKGNWSVFVTNLNGTLSRLNFGTSLSFTPSGSNLGNPGNQFKNPQSMVFLHDCDTTRAYVANESGGKITELTFDSTLSSVLATKDLGNRGIFNHPTSFIPYTEQGELYLFIADWGNHSITRLDVANCKGTINGQSVKEPKNLSSASVGKLPIALIRDFGRPHHETVCDEIDIVKCCRVAATDQIDACQSYTWNGVTYTQSNYTAQDTFRTQAGCDSIVTLALTLHQPVSTVDVIQSCGPYTWNGVTYTQDNHTAKDTLLSAGGCDSVVTLSLTVVDVIHTTDSVMACDSYTWKGRTFTNSNYFATDTLTGSQGCDSIVTLALTMHYSDSTTDSITANNHYTWNGITYTASNYSAQDTLKNIHNCDSIVTLALAIIPTGINEQAQQEWGLLELYPNPSNGVMHVKMSDLFPGAYQLKVYNVLGAMIQLANVSIDQREKTLLLDMTQVPKGKYWIRLESIDGSAAPKTEAFILY